jgi:hypothetical protein
MQSTRVQIPNIQKVDHFVDAMRPFAFKFLPLLNLFFHANLGARQFTIEQFELPLSPEYESV